ncbi:hypothetical protein CS8_061320 [Cupriavidus sp. 8B]
MRLAPVCNIVTVTAYPEYQADIPWLPLAGKRTWASGQGNRHPPRQEKKSAFPGLVAWLARKKQMCM